MSIWASPRVLRTFVCLALACMLFGGACKPDPTPAGGQTAAGEKTPASGEAGAVPTEEPSYTERVTEFALRKTILGMNKKDIERETGIIGEVSTSGAYFYPMLYDAFLVIEYKNERAAEIQIVGGATWDYRRPEPLRPPQGRVGVPGDKFGFKEQSMSDTLISHAMARIDKLQSQGKAEGNLQSVIPQIYDIVEDMLDQLCRMPEAERLAIVRNGSAAESGFLLGVARSMANKAIRDQSDEKLKYGLLALLFENCREDPRETVTELCLLNHSAQKLGVDLKQLFDSVRTFGPKEAVDFVDSYFEVGERDIRAMGYMESTDQHGFAYKQIR